MPSNPPQARPRRDAFLLAAFAALVLLAHFLTGNGYGFHRDELQLLDDARHLHFGFVAYPPLPALCGRLAIALFGISPQVFRLPATAANILSLILTALLARELGGRTRALFFAALAALPIALVLSSLMEYVSFDYLAWTLLAFFTARLLRTEDPRWWIAIGASAGLGILSKYSIAFPVLSLVAALAIDPRQRHHLRSRWFYLGALTMLLIASPNLAWLIRHHFITLQMEHAIHLRDVRIGRAEGYFTDQLKFTLLAFPIALAGILFLLRNPRFGLLRALYIGPFLLFAIARGRGYYLLPAYVPLYAAGAVTLERFLTHRTPVLRRTLTTLIALALLADAVLFVRLTLPIAHPGTHLWTWQTKNNSDLRDEIGWPEFVAQVAAIRDALTPAERDRLAIFADNYGEAGALALFGPTHNLPTPLSLTNSFYERGFGPFPPENLIITGGTMASVSPLFESCRIAGHIQIPFNVPNEEHDHPDILVCHHLLQPWPTFWQTHRQFG
jgi:hypothetical protein